MGEAWVLEPLQDLGSECGRFCNQDYPDLPSVPTTLPVSKELVAAAKRAAGHPCLPPEHPTSFTH